MEIKIYTTPNCSWCQKAKDWFKKKKLPFNELDIQENPLFFEEILERTGKFSVPVIIIDNRYIVGFFEDQIENLLKK